MLSLIFFDFLATCLTCVSDRTLYHRRLCKCRFISGLLIFPPNIFMWWYTLCNIARIWRYFAWRPDPYAILQICSGWSHQTRKTLGCLSAMAAKKNRLEYLTQPTFCACSSWCQTWNNRFIFRTTGWSINLYYTLLFWAQSWSSIDSSVILNVCPSEVLFFAIMPISPRIQRLFLILYLRSGF